RGARVVFVIEESFKGTLAAKGFEEQLMRLKPKPAMDEAPGQFWKDFIRDTARISEVNPRASRDLDQADLERTDRRIDVRERPTQSDLPGGSAGRHRPGQRRGLPGGADRRRAVDANCLLQPARGQRFGAAAQVFRT